MAIAEGSRATTGGFATTHALLGAGLQSLDISGVEHALVDSRYHGLAAVLDEHWVGTRGANRTFPQGSFRIGTVTRRVSNRTDVDIDLVTLRDLEKGSIGQAELKALVGDAVRDYASRADSDAPTVEEDDRCWTLVWPGMHMDVLPALPEPDAGTGLIIPDRGLRNWQFSDPEGYADWFTGRMRDEYRVAKALRAQELEVADVPDWQVKTTLQRSVQALKRHRDLYFINRPEHRPSSVVLTTLAALAYQGSGPLLDVLRGITGRLPEFVRHEDGVWVLPNPVQSAENFTEYWNADLMLPRYFFDWARAAESDFRALADTRGTEQVTKRIAHAFGDSVASGAVTHLTDQITASRSARGVGMLAGSGGLALTGGTGAAAAPRPARPNTFFGGPAT
jgi:hypothetical protein